MIALSAGGVSGVGIVGLEYASFVGSICPVSCSGSAITCPVSSVGHRQQHSRLILNGNGNKIDVNWGRVEMGEDRVCVTIPYQTGAHLCLCSPAQMIEHRLTITVIPSHHPQPPPQCGQ